jgi:hypothetical protein
MKETQTVQLTASKLRTRPTLVTSAAGYGNFASRDQGCGTGGHLLELVALLVL